MTEPPSKRFKQRSLTDFSFKLLSKPKVQSTSQSENSCDIQVITITDSPSSEREDLSTGKMADGSSVDGTAKLGKQEEGNKGLQHEQTCKEESTKSGDVSPQPETVTSLNRKRSNSAVTSTSPTIGLNSTELTTPDSKHKDKTKGEGETQHYEMSPDLFTDSEPQLDDSQTLEDVMDTLPPPDSTEALGTPIEELNRTPSCSPVLPPLDVTSSHTVLFYVPYQFKASAPMLPYPWPETYRDRWDSDHVRMPCSHMNEYPVNNQVKRRWNLIEKALKEDLGSTYKLEAAILSYNTRYSQKWDFSALKELLNNEFNNTERTKFFKSTLKRMAMLALRLPHLCTQPIPLLKKGRSHSITLTQQQIACLLANAFFCTFPRRNAHGKNSEYGNFPDINFNSLFAGSSLSRKIEKLRCIVHYFERVTDPKSAPFGTVTFTRQILQQLPDWNESSTKLRNLHVATDGKIEDDGQGMLQVDFANKCIGGGALGRGLVQEEIRFMICPEMIVSRLFTEVLDKNESLIMTGCERYSNYTGYSDTFRWAGDYVDCTERDEWGRCRTEVVAIDAMVIRSYSTQFKAWCVKRELDKAYCGFYTPQTQTNHLSAVCTGNWGCGAFGGEKQLKALIQLMAAAEAGRDVCYFTFDDAHLQKELFKIHAFLKEDQDRSIGDILKIIQHYYRNECDNCPTRPHISLFDYIYKVFDGEVTSEEQDDSSQETRSNWERSDEVSKKDKLATEGSIDYKADTP